MSVSYQEIQQDIDYLKISFNWHNAGIMAGIIAVSRILLYGILKKLLNMFLQP